MKQDSGNNSKNIQVAGNMNVGISAMEARQIALDVFKANFYEFSENAATKALLRAEEITDKFIEQFYENIPHLEYRLQEPSIQSTIFNTQKEFAKTGDNDLMEQLLDLLIQRIDSEDRSLKQIVLDEAIIILPKLTQDQINILSLIFSFVYFSHERIINHPALEDLLKNKLLNFYPKEKISYSFFTHLQFTGCCTLISEGGKYKPFEQILKSRYKALFIKGFTYEEFKQEFNEDSEKLERLLIKSTHNPNSFQFNPLNDKVFKSKIQELNLGSIGKKAMAFQEKYLLKDQEIISFLNSKDNNLEKFRTDWKESDLKTIRPTSVGLAIAILNYNRVTGENADIELYL